MRPQKKSGLLGKKQTRIYFLPPKKKTHFFFSSQCARTSKKKKNYASFSIFHRNQNTKIRNNFGKIIISTSLQKNIYVVFKKTKFQV